MSWLTPAAAVLARTIPPLNPLRVFDVVARTANLTSAAEELHVTQSAVSRQIAVLERYLGTQLLRRERHGVSLTPEGRRYAKQVAPAFEAIASATRQITAPARQKTVRVRTYTTFAAKWLIPRLPAFQALHPQVDVRITTDVKDVDFEADEADVAIQFGAGSWPRVRCELLMRDEIEPVCTPQLLARARQRPEALLRGRLLVSRYRRADWDDWLAATGLVAAATRAERMSFPSSILTWQAALDGLGTAIGQPALLRDELAAGRLVRPFAAPVRRDSAWYLLRPQQQAGRGVAVRAFSDWVLRETAAER
jgi:LysR family glycine cleavage system transcriptional activator